MKPESPEIAPTPAPESAILDEIQRTQLDGRTKVWEYPALPGGGYWQKTHPPTGPVDVLYGHGPIGRAGRSIVRALFYVGIVKSVALTVYLLLRFL